MATSLSGTALLALAALASGCGPIGATSVIRDAEIAVARAHTADGDRFATYETTAADLYLQKAREEQGYAHYSAASTLARKAVDLADEAVKRASDAKKDPNALREQPREAPKSEAPRTVEPPRTVIVPRVEPKEAPKAPPPEQPRPKKDNAPVDPDAKPAGPRAVEKPSDQKPADDKPAEGGTRRVIKPGEPMPDENKPRKPKAPIEIEGVK